FDPLAELVAGRRRDRDGGADAVLGTDAVAALHPAGLIEQLVRLLRVVALLGQALWRRPALRDRGAADPRLAEEKPVDDLLLGRRVDERAAQIDVTEHRMDRVRVGTVLVHGGVHLDAFDTRSGRDRELDVRVLLEVRELRLDEVPHPLYLSGLQLRDGDLACGDAAEDDLVQVRLALLAVIRVPFHGDRVAGLEVRDDERTGAQRLAAVVARADI